MIPKFIIVLIKIPWPHISFKKAIKYLIKYVTIKFKVAGVNDRIEYLNYDFADI